MAELQQLHKDPNDPPLLAVFPSGIPTVIAEQEDFGFQYIAPKDTKTTHGAYLYAESEHLRFVGSTHENYNLSKNNFNYAVGYFNPAKPSKVKIVQAHGIFTVKQASALDADGSDNSILPLDFNVVKKQVTEQFGARKNKRQLRSQEAGRVNIENDNASLQALSTQLQAINQDDSFQTTLQATEANFIATHRLLLPPFNSAATSVEDIYPFPSMFPQNLWDELDGAKILGLRFDGPKIDSKKSRALMNDDDDSDNDNEEDGDEDDELFDKKPIDATQSIITAEEQEIVNALPLFIKTRRTDLERQIRSEQTSFQQNPKAKKKLVQKVTQLALCYIVFKLARMTRGSDRLRSVDDIVQRLKISRPVAQYLCRELYRGHIGPTDENNTRILCNFVVLTLMCSEFQLENEFIQQIQTAVQLPLVELQKLYTRVGASVGASRIRLKTPLVLPSLQKNGLSAQRKK